MDEIDIALYIGYTLFILAAGAAVIMPIVNAASNPRILIKSGIGVGALLVVFVIGYLLSGDEIIPMYEDREITSNLSKVIGGALTACYILFFGGIVGIAYTGLARFFR